MYNFCISLCIMFVLLIYYDLKWSNCISYYITCSSCFRNGDIFGKETLRASLWIVPFRIIKSLFVLVNTLCAEPNVSLRSGSQFWFLFVFIILAMHLPFCSQLFWISLHYPSFIQHTMEFFSVILATHLFLLIVETRPLTFNDMINMFDVC